MDVAEVHRSLAEETYWVRGRDRATIERLVRGPTRVIGAYEATSWSDPHAWCRTVEHGVALDMFVLEGHRGTLSALSSSAKRPSIPRIATWPGFLDTRDAHAPYGRFGFEAPGDRTMLRPRRR